MNRWVLAAALAAGCTLASSAPAAAAARNYDCSKPGNANKAVCKGATKAVAPATKPAKVAKAPKAAKVAAAPKAAPKAAKVAAAPKPAPKAKAAAAATPSIFQRMSNAVRGNAAKPAPAARRVAASASASVEDKNPAGAIAQCKDGSYSHAKVRTGACSRHGGVAKWS